eukprot:6211789-Pleurochrysis_carterae.AAC.1
MKCALIESSSWQPLAEVVLPALVVLSLLRCASMVSLFNSCRVVHEQHSGAAVELCTNGVKEIMAGKVAEDGVPLGSNIAGCSLSLAGTGGNFEESGASIDRAVGKRAEVRDVSMFGLPGTSVEVEVKAVVASDALFELVMVDFLSVSVAKSVKVRHRDGLAAEHKGDVFLE